jgi:hypothetical protein
LHAAFAVKEHLSVKAAFVVKNTVPKIVGFRRGTHSYKEHERNMRLQLKGG